MKAWKQLARQTRERVDRTPIGARRVLCLVDALAIASLSLVPSSLIAFVSIPFPHVDKVEHFVSYGVLAALAIWAVAPRWPRPPGKLAAIVCLCSLYGVLMEFLQRALCRGDRMFSWSDMAANAAGAVMVAAFAYRRGFV